MDTLRFVTFLAPSLMPMYQAVTDAVGRHLGFDTELVVETSYESCLEDANDVCFVCSLPYVMYEQLGISPAVPIAAPILSGPRYRATPVYYSDVIVHRDSPFRSFLDLRGRVWAYNEPLSHSGYGITRYRLVTLGETSGFFGRVVEAGFHEDSIRMVQRGEVDGSAIDSQVLSLELKNDPVLRKQLRIVDVFGPSTIQPVAVSKRISGELRRRILEVLLGLHLDPLVRPQLERGMVERYTPVEASSYDDIRMMAAACESANFMTLK